MDLLPIQFAMFGTGPLYEPLSFAEDDDNDLNDQEDDSSSSSQSSNIVFDVAHLY